MVSKTKKAKGAPAQDKASLYTASKLASTKTNVSPVLKCAFSPFQQVSLFASVVRGLDAQRLRIHDVATARLRCEHILEEGLSINSLAWGTLRDAKKRKKRKRSIGSGAVNGIEEDDEEDEMDASQAVVGLATNRGKILLFSPAQSAIVKVLEGGHTGNIHDFQFLEDGKTGKGYSTSGDRIVEWDLNRGIMLRTINLVDKMKAYRLRPIGDAVLAAHHTTYLIDLENPFLKAPPKFSSHASQIHSIISSLDNKSFLTAADTDRVISLMDIGTETSPGSLVTRDDVSYIAMEKEGKALLAVTSDGVVELFDEPWKVRSALLNGDGEAGISARQKTRSRTSVASVRIRSSSDTLRVISANFQDGEVVLVWVENGVNLAFEKIRWRDATSGVITLKGDVDITKTKSVLAGGTFDDIATGSVMNGVKDVGRTNINQAQTVVVDGADTQDVGMVDAMDEVQDLVQDASDDAMQADDQDIENDKAEKSDSDGEDEADEPTFADKFNALHLSSQNPSNAKSRTDNSMIVVPSIGLPASTSSTKANQFQDHVSLGTVLTQALKTSDGPLLETCLHTVSKDIITATIIRLDSSLAEVLATKIADLISRKPNRVGSLLVWVEEIFIRHGGYLLTVPELLSRLSTLQRALGRRADVLPKMLLLNGKLRMLAAQIEARNRSQGPTEDESTVVYVEGENDDDKSSEDEDEIKQITNDVEEVGLISGGSESESDDEDEEVEINGINGVLDSAEEDDDMAEDEDDFDQEDGDEDAEGVGIYLDDEAEETDDDENDSESDDSFVVGDDEVDYDDNEDDILDDGSSSEGEATTSKPQPVPGRKRLIQRK